MLVYLKTQLVKKLILNQSTCPESKKFFVSYLIRYYLGLTKKFINFETRWKWIVFSEDDGAGKVLILIKNQKIV